MSGQNKASMRKKLRSALAHKRAADKLLDSIVDSQTKWNSAMTKLQADTPNSLDANYFATNAITNKYEADDEGTDAQHKASLRKTMRSALAHRKLADELCDALEEIQTAHNALMAKLDADSPTLSNTNYVSLISVMPIDRDGEGTDAQHKASLRKSLVSALANKSLADDILDAIWTLQTALNKELALLNTGVVNGSSANKVSVIQPDAE
jgi:hypothetical protein